VYLDSFSVSSEYVLWQRGEEQVRAFLTATNRGMSSWLDVEWEKAGDRANDVFDPDRHGDDLQATLFEQAVGVWPGEYFWQLSSAVLKDACSLYEVFLEQMADAVLQRVGARLAKMSTEDSWRWSDCKLFYQHYIGIDVTPPKIEAILWMRNKITHLRDELRTDAGKAEFAAKVALLDLDGPPTPAELDLGLADHRAYIPRGVDLSQLQTVRALDILREHIGVVAQQAFPFDYGGHTNSYLSALKSKSPISIKDFSTRKILAY
jgi:hypothetical protein